MERNGGVLCERPGDGLVGDVKDVHVLAVDDSLVDRKVIERLLKISSCKVTAVDSGRRALQFLGLDEEKSSVSFNGLKVDMIITDYCMPGMTGYELLKKIKGSSHFREIPVVIMSSENVLARIDRCLEEGAEDFIVKPVKLADVKRLKDYMFGEEKLNEKNKASNKRKEPEPADLSVLSSQPSIDSICSSTNDSSSQSTSSVSSRESSPAPPPRETSPVPPASPRDSSPTPSSPPLCSPTRRLKIDHVVN